MKSGRAPILILTTGILAGLATADFHSTIEVGYQVTATDFGGQTIDAYVVDVYLLSDDEFDGTPGSGDTLLNIYNWNAASGAPTSYFQSMTGAGWIPMNLGGPFEDTDALQQIDSFVTIGGFDTDALQTPGAGDGVGIDPNFGGNGASAPDLDAGWYNSNPASYIGGAMQTQVGVGVLIGRFAGLDGAFSLAGTTFGASWNQGIGTSGDQQAFAVTVPSPGSLALLGVAGVTTRRRRRSSC